MDENFQISGHDNIFSRFVLQGLAHTLYTPLEKRTQVWFELQEEIPFAHEFLMKMLPENAGIKKSTEGPYF